MSQTVRNEMVPHQNEYRDSKELSASRQWDISYMTRQGMWDKIVLVCLMKKGWHIQQLTRQVCFSGKTLCFFCFTSSNILKWMDILFGIFNQKDLEMFAGSSTDLLTFLTYLCYLLASWYLEVPVRSSRQRKEESSFVAAHGTQQTRGLDSPSKSGCFLLPPPPKKYIYIYIVWTPPPKKMIW